MSFKTTFYSNLEVWIHQCILFRFILKWIVDRQTQTCQQLCHFSKLPDQQFALCWQSCAACIFWTRLVTISMIGLEMRAIKGESKLALNMPRLYAFSELPVGQLCEKTFYASQHSEPRRWLINGGLWSPSWALGLCRCSMNIAKTDKTAELSFYWTCACKALYTTWKMKMSRVIWVFRHESQSKIFETKVCHKLLKIE